MKPRQTLIAIVALILTACGPASQTVPETADTVGAEAPAEAPIDVKINHPEWSKDAVIYQINTRQYSQAGDFAAVEADIPRIKSLGVDILWFMPIHPIGETKRKGKLGSPYAVKDFQAVNPDLGTLADFKSLVAAAHANDMKVIIDWVANHTAWDNPLITDHPEWYTRDAAGNMQHPPDTDWIDVADLDYSQDGLRNYMTESLLYWVQEVGIDGYRCDVAGMVPTDFWNSVRPKLDAIKPVFMLAEWQDPALHEFAFDASYAWRWKEIMQDIVNGKADVESIREYYLNNQTSWPRDSMRMVYTENHDQNSWDGSTDDIYGDALEAVMVLSFIGEGIPLIYNGQEAGNQRRLEFFEKDLIEWDTHPHGDLIAQLSTLKSNTPVLWNGAWGAQVEPINTTHPEKILSFIRQNDTGAVLAVFNFSGDEITVEINEDGFNGAFEDFKSGENVSLTAKTKLTLNPWDYRIYTR